MIKKNDAKKEIIKTCATNRLKKMLPIQIISYDQDYCIMYGSKNINISLSRVEPM